MFGSKSRFDELCLEVVTKIKEKYPNVKRIYVRAVYVERNCEMIQNSRYCIVYYDENNAPKTRKSGTKIALDFATKLNKEIIVLP